MRYEKVVEGQFLRRPNRFIAHVLLDGQEEIVHVKNTGRCKELLTPGASVRCAFSDNPNRKTRYDLIAVRKGDYLINMDSQAPNEAVGEWLRGLDGVTVVRPETKFGSSRFDFYLEWNGKKVFLEVKGVTLEENGVCRFPDAPTERGARHLRELIEAKKAGYEACALFVIQMKPVLWLEPNDGTDPAFGRALREAKAAGVNLLAVDCIVTGDSMTIGDMVEIKLPTE